MEAQTVMADETDGRIPQYQHAADVARAAAQIIEKASLYRLIKNKKYIFLEGWQAIGAAFGLTVAVRWVRQFGGESVAFRAKVDVVRSDGVRVGSAIASCSRDESLWSEERGREDFQLESMAQTRAAAKALRLVLAWIPAMIGYEGTPAEEMEEGDPPKLKVLYAPARDVPPQPAAAAPKPSKDRPKVISKGGSKSVTPKAGDDEGALRQRLMAVMMSHWKSRDEAKLALKKLTGRDRTHDLTRTELDSLTRAVKEVLDGLAHYDDDGVIVRLADGVVLAGKLPVAARKLPPDAPSGPPEALDVGEPPGDYF